MLNINLLKNLKTKKIGKKCFFYEEIDSTQKEIWRRLEKNIIADGSIIIAQTQTDAVGTHGRKWYTTQKNNIAFSIVINPNCSINKLDGFTVELARYFC